MAGKIVHREGFQAVNKMATFDPSIKVQKMIGPNTGLLVKAANDGNSNVSNVLMGAAALKGAYDTGKETIAALREANINPNPVKNMRNYTLSNYGGRRKRKRTKHRRSKR